MSHDESSVACDLPAERWESVPPLPDTLVSALDDSFATHGETLYYERDGVWYAVHRERVGEAQGEG